MEEDGVAAVGNLRELNGKAGFHMMFRDLAKSVSGLRHETHDLWQVEQDADVLVARMTVAYTRHDGSTISLPCCNVFRMRANLVSHYSLYMHITPAPPAHTPPPLLLP